MLFDNIPIVLLALAMDAIIGDPNWLYRKIPHPIAAIGCMMNQLDLFLNRPQVKNPTKKILGVLFIIIALSVAGIIGWGMQTGLKLMEFGQLLEAILVSIFLAQNSLYRHVRNVAQALVSDGLDAARLSVSHIVGRDPATLDDSGVCRASIESLSENFSDGVIAPVFWYLIAGIPGILMYKTLNTADSMVGHLSPKYKYFGWASARLDDAANFIPARLTALLIFLTALIIPSTKGFKSLRSCLTYANRHRSTNAGWPEAAMAGALDIRIAGPRVYNGIVVNDPWMGDGNPNLRTNDINRALKLYFSSNIINALILVLLLFI
tara:strand:- start:441 stop:1403 length:963 start_codon:yes stop_codon:yes gene_type:complete